MNCDNNGVRYSVFSFNELADWCNQDLFYGEQARDLSYEEALSELKAEKHQEVRFEVEDGKLEFASEEDFLDEVNDRVAEAAERIQIDEPVIEGTLDGIKYKIGWLGGASLLWIIEGLPGVGKRLCSPCVPGAVDGAGGYYLITEETPSVGGYFECHCPPRSWLRPQT
jgi:hypothetical protein